MLTIPEELNTFYDKVSVSIDGMNSTATSLSSKLSQMLAACSVAQSGFTSNYNSANKTSVISSFAQLSSLISTISESVSSDLKTMLSKSDEILTKVKKMKDLITEITTQEGIISDENAKGENCDRTRLSNAQTAKSKAEQEYNQNLTEATNALSALKAMDADLNTTEEPQQLVRDPDTGEFRYDLLNLKEGTYTQVTYTGKNGTKINTYIYLPVGAKTTTGLAVDLSMGGDGAKNAEGSKNEPNQGRGALGAGVGQQLKQGAQYSGIVVVLEAYNDKSYSDPNYLDTAKELTDNIVATYKADPDKISINGYSYGGTGVIHMVERFPDYFSQAVVVAQGNAAIGKESGGNQSAGYEKLKKTKFHLICGTKDYAYGQMKDMYSKLSNGGVVTYQWYQNEGHEVNFFYPVTINGVTYPNYVEFCLAQKKS